jgi:hypothetical protein
VKVLWFYVFDFHPDSTRTQPIGAWITKDGSLDYVFDPAFPDDEQMVSDVVNALVERGLKEFPRESLEYWREHLGYYRSAGEILEEPTDDYAAFFSRINCEVGGVYDLPLTDYSNQNE